MLFPLFVFVFLLPLPPAVRPESKLRVQPTVIHFCDRSAAGSCGAEGGVCVQRLHGNRCECPAGWMGGGCARPCQDVYRSCTRWLQEGRCQWTRHISAFFLDNCALTCGACTQGQRTLPVPLPPLLEPLAWLVGRWQMRTFGPHTDRFPAPMAAGPYREVIDVQIADVPSFDRPPLNISVRSRSLDGQDEHNELGFMTVLPAHEENGFLERGEAKWDKVALELVSNTGTMTIEEGVLVAPRELRLATKWHRRYADPGPEQIQMDTVKRTFRLSGEEVLEERLEFTLLLDGGERRRKRRVTKRFRRVRDYLGEF